MEVGGSQSWDALGLGRGSGPMESSPWAQEAWPWEGSGHEKDLSLLTIDGLGVLGQ